MTQLPAIFDELPDDADALSSGLTGGFAVVSIRSGRFRLKYQGVETVITDEHGHPVPALQVFIVKASPAIAKVFYKNGYQDGSDDPPDCFSNDGISPDPSVAEPVCAECARCPKNVIGSRITEAGTKVKACSDTRRVAVVPANDIPNEQFGGPMLLRVPAASLGNLADFGRKLKQRGFKYGAIVTEVSFDVEASYPKLRFRPARVATAEEVPLIVEQVKNPVTELICHTVSTDEFRQDPAPAAQRAAAPQPPPQAAPQPPPQAAPQPPPQLEQKPVDEFDALLQQVATPQPTTQPTAQPAKPRAAKKTQAAAQPAAASAPPQPPQNAPEEDPSGDALEEDVKALLASLDA